MGNMKILDFNGRPLIVAEVAQTHEGSLGQAHAFIDATARAGADAIKFQTHIAASESTRSEPWRVKFSPKDETRYEYWRRMEFSESEWQGLKQHAVDRGLSFLSSPFSLEAFALLTRVGVSGWKIASGETQSDEIVDLMLATGLPILASTGMSNWVEIDQMVENLKSSENAFCVLQCTSRYPTPANALGLNVISEMKSKYDCHVGLSDHCGTTTSGVAALTLGASALEVHVCFSREMFGPDVPVSLDFSELKRLCDARDFLYEASSNPVDKDQMASDLAGMRAIFQKSLCLKEPLRKGMVVVEENLCLKKPGTGLAANVAKDIIGRRLKRDVSNDELLSLDDFS